jgi:hypothetical protein
MLRKISSRRHVSRGVLGTVFAVLAGAALSQADAQSAAATSSSAPARSPAVSAAPGVHGSKKQGATARAPLDLHAPPLSHIYPSSELRYILAANDSSTDSDTEVSVKSSKAVVRVPGAPGNQLQAIPWAIVHPTQAWRIFTPLVEE